MSRTYHTSHVTGKNRPTRTATGNGWPRRLAPIAVSTKSGTNAQPATAANTMRPSMAAAASKWIDQFASGTEVWCAYA